MREKRLHAWRIRSDSPLLRNLVSLDHAAWLWWLVLSAWGGVGLGLLIGFWPWMSESTDGGPSNGETLRNLVLMMAAWIGLPLAIWRSKIAQHGVEVAELDHRSGRFEKGVEMLGSPTLTTRLGGISALKNLASRHPEDYYVQVVESLCNFIRFPTPDPLLESKRSQQEDDDNPKVSPDVEAAAKAVSDVRKEHGKACWSSLKNGDNLFNLKGANLPSADLWSANLSRANLGHAILSNANLARAALSRADLWGADLSSADLTSAKLCRAIMKGAKLCHAKLNGAELCRANLYNAKLCHANLYNAKLCHAKLIGAKLCNANLWDANLSSADLTRANLSSADLTSANLSRANLSNADLSGASGLTQNQLDQARIWGGNDPPNLTGVLGPDGSQLVWRGEALGWLHEPE